MASQAVRILRKLLSAFEKAHRYALHLLKGGEQIA
jgi:hypothetical protein